MLGEHTQSQLQRLAGPPFNLTYERLRPAQEVLWLLKRAIGTGRGSVLMQLRWVVAGIDDADRAELIACARAPHNRMYTRELRAPRALCDGGTLMPLLAEICCWPCWRSIGLVHVLSPHWKQQALVAVARSESGHASILAALADTEPPGG